MAIATEIIAAADRVADRALLDLEVLRRLVVRDIVRVLQRIPTTDTGAIAARAELRNLAAVRASVLSTMEIRGSRAVVTLAERAAADAAREAAAALAVFLRRDDPLFDPAFMPRPDSAIERVAGPRIADIARLFTIAQGEIRSAINVGTTTGIPLDDLVKLVSLRADVAFNRTRAVVDTAIISVGRAMIMDGTSRANALVGEDRFLLRYVGPLDRKTRPFCRHILTGIRVYTEGAIAQMDNGQGIPVRETCGGYRCRHQWAPITIFEVQRRGWAIGGAVRRLAA